MNKLMLTKGALLAGAAVCGLSSCAALGDKQAEKPNILFILADDHATSAISAYGGINAKLAPTPNIDMIAENGVLMDNMLCTNAISGPSRASLITGKYSTAHGLYQNEGGIIFDNTQQTYQQILQDNGYTTALFGKWHLYSQPKGFDYYMIHGNASQQGTYWDPLYETNGQKERIKGYATTITANSALKWLDSQRDTEKPFCMMLHFKAPHRPWEPDSCYQHLFDDVHFPHPATFDDDYSGREETLGENMATIANHMSRHDMKLTPPAGLSKREQNKWLWYGGSGKGQFWSPDKNMTPAEVKDWKFQRYIKDYLRVVRSVDDQVGRVISYLKEKGLYENTLIVYMGDQGFFLGEHGIYDKRWMYEEAIHMPCLVSYPKKIPAGQKLQSLGLNIDIAPTILDFAGVTIPEDMQGESMKELLIKGDDEVPTWRQVAYYQYFEYPKWHNVQPHFGVRNDRYKLIHFYYNIDKWEFYDLKKDIHELHNEYDNPEYKTIIAEMKKQIQESQIQYGDTMSLDNRRKMTDRYMLKYEE